MWSVDTNRWQCGFLKISNTQTANIFWLPRIIFISFCSFETSSKLDICISRQCQILSSVRGAHRMLKSNTRIPGVVDAITMGFDESGENFRRKIFIYSVESVYVLYLNPFTRNEFMRSTHSYTGWFS